MKRDYIASVGMFSVLLLLSGCEKPSKHETEVVEKPANARVERTFIPAGDTSEVIVRIDGQPILTRNMVEQEKIKLMEANPQLKAMIPFMDEAQINQNIAEGKLRLTMIEQYLAKHNLTADKKYIQEFEDAMDNVKNALNVKFFSDRIEVPVTDVEVTEFYDSNKDEMDELVISRGGVKAKGVHFDHEEAARAFADKVRELGGDIDKAVKDAELADKLEDFNLVNEMSVTVDQAIKDHVLSMDSLPGTDVVIAGDNDVWVVQAIEKEDKKYRPLEEIKEDLRSFIERNKREEALESRLKELEQEYNVEKDELFFKKAENVDAQQAMNDEEDFDEAFGDEMPEIDDIDDTL